MSSKVKVNKAEAGIVKILEALRSKEKLTVAEMMELLGVNRQSVYNYLKRMEIAGIKLHAETEGRTVLYSLAENSAEISKYEAMDFNVLRSFNIVRMLQQKPMEPKELIKRLKVRSRTNLENANDFSYNSSDLGRTQFDKLIRKLLEKGVLVQNKKRDTLYPTGQLVPILIDISQDELWELCDKIETVAPGNPYYGELKNIYNKLCSLEGDFSEVDHSIYHVFGRKYLELSSVRKNMEKLPLQSCISKVVKYYYRSNKTDKLERLYMATGIIVYSADKDKVYIIGKQAGPSRKNYSGYRVIRLDSVERVEETERPNIHWQTDEFKELYLSMYSITSEPKLEKIVVEFDNVGNIKSKLENLMCQRNNATLKILDDKIIYTDYVRGLPDVENYLRQYGKSCRVIESEKLKKIMQESVLKTLASYKKFEEEVNNGSLL